MTVPLHPPTCWPPASFMLSRTTGELSVGQSAPLTILIVAPAEAVCVTASQAALMGRPGAGVGDVDGPPPPPPHAAASASTSTTGTRGIIFRPGLLRGGRHVPGSFRL